MSKRVTIAYHGHCFDGMFSAAFLTSFLREHEREPLEVKYRGLDHQPGGSFVPPTVLTGQINAVVDFRYSCSDKLTWWFDHHESGIVGEQEREHYRLDRSGRKFFDPSYGSCCKLIADIASERFGCSLPSLDNLVRWADLIDSARFPTPEMPVALREPALQLMTVLEVHGNERFVAPRIAKLADGATLDEVASESLVQRLFAPLCEQQAKTREIIRLNARQQGRVVSFDLVGTGSDRYNKFIPYCLFPDADYAIAVTAGKHRAKVSVGWNPWSTEPRKHNISALCAEFGGGGHATVGAVSLQANEVDRARKIGAAIAVRLSG